MNKKLMQFAVALAILAVAMPGAVWAASVDDSDTITITVPTVLSISDEAGNFTLAFTSSVNGAVTGFQPVGYIVKSNNMTNSALAGALSAKIASLVDGINLRALTGRTYTNNGTASNALLAESSNGTVAVGTSATALMDKPSSTGDSGKILDGTAFVSWQAQATRDLTAADSGKTFSLTVTLKDA